MKLKFLQAKYKGKFEIPENFIDIVKKHFKNKKNPTIAIYGAVQFLDMIQNVSEILQKENFKVITSQPDRTTYKSQILGCDSYAHNLKIKIDSIDGFVYIGDGYFHPTALLYAQENLEVFRPVIIINIPQQIVDVIDEKKISQNLKKRKGNLLKFYMSKNIGVFITTKCGQEHKKNALQLQKIHPDKNIYYFVGDNFLENEMENFPFIECWVNTACPRIGQDDVLKYSKPIVNLKDIWKNKKD